jgi:hypothetical protein
MADREAAARLKRELRIAMSGKGIDTWERLGVDAGVSSTTIENWIYARTVPQAKQLRIVGEYLRPHTDPARLEAAYAGLAPPEPPLLETLRELVPELHELIVLLRAQADEAVLEAVRDALEERRRGSAGSRAAANDDETSP